MISESTGGNFRIYFDFPMEKIKVEEKGVRNESSLV